MVPNLAFPLHDIIPHRERTKKLTITNSLYCIPLSHIRGTKSRVSSQPLGGFHTVIQSA